MEVILLIVHNHILEKKLIKNILTNMIIIHNLNNNLVIPMEIVQLYHLYLQLLYNMLDIINTVNIRIWEVIYILVIIVVVQILIH